MNHSFGNVNLKIVAAVLVTLAMITASAVVLANDSNNSSAAGAWNGTDATYDWYGDGSADSFEISSASDLKGLANIVNGEDGKTANSLGDGDKKIILTDNIDLNNKLWTPIGKDAAHPFSGFVSSNAPHSLISNLNVNVSGGSSDAYAGLFGYCYLAQLSRIMVDGSVSCTSDANAYVGGLVGYLKDSRIDVFINKCSVTYSGTGTGYVGGIAGASNAVSTHGGSLNGSMNLGNVTATNCSNAYVGGISGYHTLTVVELTDVKDEWYTNFINSNINHGDISVSASSSSYAGGIAGYCSILNSSNIVLSGNDYVHISSVQNYTIGNISSSGSTDTIRGALFGHFVENSENPEKITENDNYWLYRSGLNAIGEGGSGADTPSECAYFYNEDGKLYSSTGGTETDLNQTLTMALESNVYLWEVNDYPSIALYWSIESGYDASWYDPVANTYSIDTPMELAGFARLVNAGTDFEGKTVELTADLDMSGYVWPSIGNSKGDTFTGFNGTFDGNGHKISDLNTAREIPVHSEVLNRYDYSMGLFRTIDSNGTVKDVDIEISAFGFQPKEQSTIGGIASFNNGTITGCSVSGDLEFGNEMTYYIGGIAGYNNGTIADCSSSVTISNGSDGKTGGIAGRNEGTIKDCSNSGSISSANSAGGIVGAVVVRASPVDADPSDVVITGCTNSGDVTGRNNDAVGGIVGTIEIQLYSTASARDIDITLSDLWNYGDVKNGTSVGGIVGLVNLSGINTNDGGVTGTNSITFSAENSFNTGSVSSSLTDAYPTGGIIGNLTASSEVQKDAYLTAAKPSVTTTIDNCYTLTGIAGNADVTGAIIGTASLYGKITSPSAETSDYGELSVTCDIKYTYAQSTTLSTLGKAVQETASESYPLSVVNADCTMDSTDEFTISDDKEGLLVAADGSMSDKLNSRVTAANGWSTWINGSSKDIDTPIFGKVVSTSATLIGSNAGASNGTATIATGNNSMTVTTAVSLTNYEVTGYYLDSACTIKIADGDGKLVLDKDGYTDDFGWIYPNSTVTLYAKMALITYTISWYNGTVLIDTDEVNAGDIPAYGGQTPTKASTAQYEYTFDTWTPTVAAANADTSYTATFTQITRQYDVEIDANGGTPSESGWTLDNGVYSKEFDYNAVVTLPTFTKVSTVQYAYTFTAWNPATVTVTGDVEMSAEYTETVRKYAVTITDSADHSTMIVKNGSATVTTGNEIAYGTVLTIETTAGTGYVALVNGDESLTQYKVSGSNTITLTERLGTYSVFTVDDAANASFVIKNGSAVVNNGDEVTYGTVLTITITTDEGYTASVNGTKNLATYTVTEANNLVLTSAVNSYEVTFDSNDGSSVDSKTVDYGSLIEKVSSTYAGYILSGWYNGTALWNFGTDTMIAHDMTLTAKWTAVSNGAANVTGGNGEASVTVATGVTSVSMNLGGNMSVSITNASTMTNLAGKDLTVGISALQTAADTYEVTMTLDGNAFTGGAVNITIPYSGTGTPEVYWNNNGTLERMTVVSTDTANSTVTFETTHNSEYVVKYASPDDGGMNIWLIAGIVIAVLAVAAVGFIIYRKGHAQ